MTGVCLGAESLDHPLADPDAHIETPRRWQRRDFLGQSGRWFAWLALPAALGCGAPGLDCSDEEFMSTPERTLRAAQAYRERSPQGAANSCAKCHFFHAAAPEACGSCQILGGPVNPAGHCNSWVARA